MYHCALENITVLVTRKTESVIATDHELSVAVSSKDPVQNRQNSLSISFCPTVRDDEVAVHC